MPSAAHCLQLSPVLHAGAATGTAPGPRGGAAKGTPPEITAANTLHVICLQAVHEQLQTILGHEPKDVEVDRVLASGDRQAVLAGLMTNRNEGALQSVLTQMEGRLTGVEALSREVEEIVHVMQGMARMVKDQEAKIDNTRTAVENTAFELDAGTKVMTGAIGFKAQAMKLKAWIIFVLIMTIIAVIGIVLLVTLGPPK
jgi:t-SNARE complex subunit (syntaxin)